MATSDLTRALDEAGVSYELLSHAHTESALAEAESLGVSPDDVAKTLIVKLPEGYLRAVLPAQAATASAARAGERSPFERICAPAKASPAAAKGSTYESDA